MIKYFRYAFLALMAVILITVALANRTPVTVKLLPDDLAAVFMIDWQVELPMFLVIFAGIMLGLLIGFVWEWFREMKHRSTASLKSREVLKLERELAMLRDATSLPKDDVLVMLDKVAGK
jgi:uncharacterized integral membrane protein